jgi:hypothetical protein
MNYCFDCKETSGLIDIKDRKYCSKCIKYISIECSNKCGTYDIFMYMRQGYCEKCFNYVTSGKYCKLCQKYVPNHFEHCVFCRKCDDPKYAKH